MKFIFTYFILACNCITIGTRNASIICNDSGVCFCKENVQGIKCDNCVPGTFNLADSNEYGCTRCSCSGITTDCTSTTLYKSEVRIFSVILRRDVQ